MYVMMDINLRMHSCKSGNEMKRVYNLNPANWITGPVWLPLSKEDSDRIDAATEQMISNF